MALLDKSMQIWAVSATDIEHRFIATEVDLAQRPGRKIDSWSAEGPDTLPGGEPGCVDVLFSDHARIIQTDHRTGPVTVVPSVFELPHGVRAIRRPRPKRDVQK